MRHQQQMLVYGERNDDIATVAHALDLLRQNNSADAARVLTIYLDRLQEAQKPKIIDYDQKIDLAGAACR